ncbi:hypothetical protein DFH09DRAFT_42263 [Mycena vulgaris]|nr:hypothetical protein DFH09DRAFT_508266 [Mycena vulgaris]KAJ6543289.1 hypothetical protein DFH09DRAFT_42263 [Mycena vulgaris]
MFAPLTSPRCFRHSWLDGHGTKCAHILSDLSSVTRSPSCRRSARSGSVKMLFIRRISDLRAHSPPPWPGSPSSFSPRHRLPAIAPLAVALASSSFCPTCAWPGRSQNHEDVRDLDEEPIRGCRSVQQQRRGPIACGACRYARRTSPRATWAFQRLPPSLPGASFAGARAGGGTLYRRADVMRRFRVGILLEID